MQCNNIIMFKVFKEQLVSLRIHKGQLNDNSLNQKKYLAAWSFRYTKILP